MMKQNKFNKDIDKEINAIATKYYYNDEDLRAKIFNEVYEQLDHNFEEFDDVVVSHTPLNAFMLIFKVELISNKKVIQTLRVNV